MHEPDVEEYFGSVSLEFSEKYSKKADFKTRYSVCTGCIGKHAGVAASGRVAVDVGCGSGLFAVFLAQLGYRVLAVDQCEEMLLLARENARRSGVEDRMEFMLAGVPFAAPMASEVDMVLCLSVMEYVDDVHGFLQWVHARLGTGGKLILSVPNRLSLYRTAEGIFRGVGIVCPSYLRYQKSQYTLAGITELLGQHGFGYSEHRYFGMPSFLYRFAPHLEGRHWSTMLLGVFSKIGPSNGRAPARILVHP